MDRGAWWATVHRVAQSQTRLKQLSPWRVESREGTTSPASLQEGCRYLLPGRLLLTQYRKLNRKRSPFYNKDTVNAQPEEETVGATFGNTSLDGKSSFPSPLSNKKAEARKAAQVVYVQKADAPKCQPAGREQGLGCGLGSWAPRGSHNLLLFCEGLWTSFSPLQQRPTSPQDGCRYLLPGRLLLTHRGHCGKCANETLGAGLTPRLPSSPAGRGLALKLHGPSSAPLPAGAQAPALGAEAPPPCHTALTMLHLNLPPPTAGDSPLTYNSWDIQMGATLNSAPEKRTWSPTAAR